MFSISFVFFSTARMRSSNSTRMNKFNYTTEKIVYALPDYVIVIVIVIVIVTYVVGDNYQICYCCYTKSTIL